MRIGRRGAWAILLVVLAIPTSGRGQGIVPAAPPVAALPIVPASPPSDPPVAALPADTGWVQSLPAAQGVFLTGEFLYLVPQREGLGFAVVSQQKDGNTLSNTNFLSWSGTPAFRLGGGYRLPDSGVELAVSVLYLHAKTQSTVTAPDGGNLSGTLATGARNAMSADGDAGLDYGVIDLDIGKTFRSDDGLGLKVFGGVRLASIDQTLKSIYSGGSLGDGSDYVNSPIHFRGAGLSAGAEGSWDVYRGWGVYGRGRLALVSGQFHDDRTEINGGAVVGSSTDSFGTVIPVVELGAGLKYQADHFFFSAGYQVIDWVNMVSGPAWTGNSSTAKRGDLTLQGLSLKTGFTF